MLKSALTALVPLIIAVLTVPATAQQGMPGGKWWKMPAVVRQLDLSAQEVEQLDDAYRESRRVLIRLKADIQTEQLELEHLVESRDLDETRALAQYQKLDRARSALGVERFRFLLTVRKIVGQDRFSSLLRLREKRQERMKRGGQRAPAAGE